MDVSVRELKNHLSEYLRRTRAGEELQITSHGRPVGRLAPPLPAAQATDGEALARLQALPGVRVGNGRPVQGGHGTVTVPAGTTQEIVDWVRDG